MNFGTQYGVLMRLHEIDRWLMVPMRRRQSVAEHTFRVMVIAKAIYEKLYPVPHNSDDTRLLERWSMWHDADEYWTADIPSPVKQMIKESSQDPEIFDKIAAQKFRYSGQQYLDLKRGVKGTIVELIVKLADVIEALNYLHEYNIDYDTGHLLMVPSRNSIGVVQSYLEGLLSRTMEALEQHPLSKREWQRDKRWLTGPTDPNTFAPAPDAASIRGIMADIANQDYRTDLMNIRHLAHENP